MGRRVNARQRAILREVEGREYVEVKELAHRLDVDVSTIRRDLQVLVADDLVERLHGGVRRRTGDSKSALHPPRRLDELLRDPRSAGPGRGPVVAGVQGDLVAPPPGTGVDAIASTARRMIRNGDRIALGAGICIDHLVSTLFDIEDLTVITTDLRSAERLGRHPQLRVVIAGGELRDAPGSTVVSGSSTAEFLAAQHADWVFLEIDGIHPFAGVTTSHPWHVSTARALLAAGDRRVGLARAQAFGARCVGFIAEPSELDLIITDAPLPDSSSPTRTSPTPTSPPPTAPPPTCPTSNGPASDRPTSDLAASYLPGFTGRVVRASLDPTEDWHADVSPTYHPPRRL